MQSVHGSRGTTLVEAVIALGILAGAVVALAGLASAAIRTSALARDRSMSTLLAVQKIEALCLNATSTPASPADAWAVDTAGYVEYLDAHGSVTPGRDGGAYVRRWSVAPVSWDGNLVAIQVSVEPCRAASGAARCGDSAARVRLASIRSRIAW